MFHGYIKVYSLMREKKEALSGLNIKVLFEKKLLVHVVPRILRILLVVDVPAVRDCVAVDVAFRQGRKAYNRVGR